MDHILSELSTMTHPSWVVLHGMAHSFIELDKAVVHVIRLISFDCKEQYCIGTWNVRSMNQDKLKVVKQEIASMNINILGISEIKWIGMGEFNSDDHNIYYCGQECLRRNGVALIVNKKSSKCSTWVQSQKWQNDLCWFPRQTIQYHSNPSLCPKQ